jgi:hypothetical protein
LVFGDPTGLFTMMEINVNLSTQNLFRMAKVAAVMEIRDRALEKVGEVVANVLYNIVSMLVGLQGGHFGVLGQATTKATQLGAMFEKWLSQQMVSKRVAGVIISAR